MSLSFAKDTGNYKKKKKKKNNTELISIHPSLLGQRGFVSVDLRPAGCTELNHNELFKRVGKMEALISVIQSFSF